MLRSRVFWSAGLAALTVVVVLASLVASDLLTLHAPKPNKTAIIGGTPILEPQPTSMSWLTGQWRTADGRGTMDVRSDGDAVLSASGMTIYLNFRLKSGRYEATVTRDVPQTGFIRDTLMRVSAEVEAGGVKKLTLTGPTDPLELYTAG